MFCFKSHREEVQIHAPVIFDTENYVSNPIGKKFKYSDFKTLTESEYCFKSHREEVQIYRRFSHIFRESVSNPIGKKFKSVSMPRQSDGSTLFQIP